ncbi:bifunctional riboflavin kinase/FAD synthetase [Aquibacillus koreensis]|uniref:Riboflavin biosynthesis protein n=1 Tax=Aquibacillus koreensis TaxID=279446 RepID=A0A9X4AJ45_9BACI|nr:bifunctional riboflavin kinase/FAD synthetase [Aquibacillus koreensis]MCT2534569.1 bifunctional riboflavin kinase/FAD synthetase [Aquibacillus koreensis]MDC3421837.1 bifunctional riboflavin kinase/FAD synthetase [Aquibacillus koreensis]
MEVMTLTYPLEINTVKLPEAVAAIGFFDGIHKGHQKVIQAAKHLAQKQNRQSVVITFFPHPSVVLKREEQRMDYLTPLREKEEILREMGIDKLYIITFNEQLSKLDPQEFINHFIVGLHIKHLVTGFDFSYGYKGKGTTETIVNHANGNFDYTIIPKEEKNNEKISSTLIRQHLRQGQIKEMNELLGRCFAIRGKVIKGDQRGRTIGYPTANLDIEDNYFLPKVGVYAVTVIVDDVRYQGMANLGYKPTFKDNMEKPSIEVHLFDYKNDLYGKELKIEWRNYIRDEMKFDHIDQLLNQIKQDEIEIRNFFDAK